MTPKEFRAAAFAEVQAWAAANFPAMPVLYENGPTPDEDAMGAIWLDIEIRWYGSTVAAIGTPPRVRHTGALSAMCFYRSGEGTDEPDSVVDSLSEYLQARRLGAGVLEAAQRTVPTNVRGWFKSGVFIPFTLG
jgi:hypothetical protein